MSGLLLRYPGLERDFRSERDRWDDEDAKKYKFRIFRKNIERNIVQEFNAKEIADAYGLPYSWILQLVDEMKGKNRKKMPRKTFR